MLPRLMLSPCTRPRPARRAYARRKIVTPVVGTSLFTRTGDCMHRMIIVGSGPAGYTAAIYAARAGLEPVMFASSVSPGGELMNTTDVENFPGFPEGIQGPDLMQKMQEQAEKFGMKLVFDDVT